MAALTEPVPEQTEAAATWKVLEPDERTDRVRHEVWRLVERGGGWKLVAASLRGRLHAHKALWRDDAFALGYTGRWTIIAVSDGAGSASLSRVGAHLACEHATRTLERSLTENPCARGGNGLPADTDLEKLRTLIAGGARAARRAIVREAQIRGCVPNELNTTLLLAVHSPLGEGDLIGAFQVGDGAIGVYGDNGVCTVLGRADRGEYSSETLFLTTPLIERRFARRVRFAVGESLRCLAVMSDGVSDDFFPEDQRLVELFEGDPIEGIMTKEGSPVRGVVHEVLRQPRDGRALRDWLTYERKGSSDDRTLVLMYRNDSR